MDYARLLAACLALTLACGCMGGQPGGTTTTSTASTLKGAALDLSACWRQVSLDCHKAYRCYRDAAWSGGGGICDLIQNQDEMFYCLSAARGDPALCGGIADDDVRSWCYIASAQDKWDKSVCEQAFMAPELARWRYMCVSRVAAAIGEASVCDGIQKPSVRDDCYSGVAAAINNPAACGRIEDQYTRESCIVNVAAATHNISLCGGIETAAQKEVCLFTSR